MGFRLGLQYICNAIAKIKHLHILFTPKVWDENKSVFYLQQKKTNEKFQICMSALNL